MKNNKTKKYLIKQFTHRLEALAFNQREIGALFGRSPRCIGYYLRGQRGIPTAIWAKLGEIEKIPREDLCRMIVNERKINT